ncbi:MAG TPA: hypothetical protein VH374_02885 [Polyangia bacterium]|nr:hypothetical protein [Polyangia bacterium]
MGDYVCALGATGIGLSSWISFCAAYQSALPVRRGTNAHLKNGCAGGAKCVAGVCVGAPVVE